MPRFDKRQIQWADIIGRFETKPYSYHLHNALGLIGVLKDEGSRFWDKDSGQILTWQRYCTDLWTFLNKLGQRRDTDKQGLETTMREFIQEFEHSTGRMFQMLYGAVSDPDHHKDVKEITGWFDLIFRSSTYALVSAWIDDKRETDSLTTVVDLKTGGIRQEGTRTEMKIPRKYQSRTRRL